MNRILLLLFLVLITSCADWARNPASSNKIRHIVFDIDWTLTSEVKTDMQGPRIISVEGKKYFIMDGVEEFVEDLLSRKDTKISFFSGGSKERNHVLLQKIKLSDGRSLEEIAFKILNREDLTTSPGALPTDKFSVRFKKDLTKISKDLSELIMIDDTENFTLNNRQNEHVIGLGKTYEYLKTFQASKEAVGEYVPRSIDEWSFAKYKLSIIHGAVNSALIKSEEQGVDLSEAMQIEKMQLNLASNQWNDYSNKMYEQSRRLSKQKSSATCLQLMTSFIDI
jgi:hypothetical protein